MSLENVPLARQVDYVFRELEQELTNSTAGTITIQIRNNAIGKFGLRHHPIESRNGEIRAVGSTAGMSVLQVRAFRQMAVDALKHRHNWSHGEIMYDYAVKDGASSWSASVSYESNYNSANWMFRYQPKQRPMRESQ